MAGSGLLLLIDDITAVLDDIAVMTKVATRKTAGVLGDDLALNAEQVTGVSPRREIPVVWAVAKGSFVNKLILVPGALAISYFVPVLLTPLLALGGLYLCYEGFEKVVHKIIHSRKEVTKEHSNHIKAVLDPAVDLVSLEKGKIKGAIRTDFILSAEIIVISLATVAEKPFSVQIGVLSAISLLMTVFIYGLVAGIVKIDDLGIHLTESKTDKSFKTMIGKSLLLLSPLLMRVLSVLGTAAMFLVGGGIVVHAVPALEHYGHDVFSPLLYNGFVGLTVGGLLVFVVTSIKKLFDRDSPGGENSGH